MKRNTVAPEPDDDPALEADLLRLNLAARPLPPDFANQVLAALPARLPIIVSTARRPAWWQRPSLATALGGGGLALMAASADMSATLGGWWDATGTWLGSFAAEESSGLDLAFGGLGTADSGWGLMLGALALAVGAGGYLWRTLESNPLKA